MRVPLAIFAILAIMLFYAALATASTDLYVDYIAIDGKSFVMVDKPGLHALVSIKAEDSVEDQVKTVCKVIKCNNRQKEKD